MRLFRHKRFARGEIVDVLTPSPLRVEPRCHHFSADRCGGCQLQHLNSDAQRNVRASIARDALTRIARRDVSAPMVEPGPSDWEYRRRLTLTVHRHDDKVVGGLHRYDNPGALFDLQECPITAPALVATWQHVRQHLHMLPFVPMLRVALRGRNDGLVTVVVIGGSTWPAARKWSREVLRHDKVAEVWWESERGEHVLIATRDRALNVQPANDSASHTADALAFVQVNAPVAATLRNYILEHVVRLNPHHVIEAYSGSGILTAQLAQCGFRVTAIEVDAHATRRARERAGDRASVDIITDRVDSALPGALEQSPDMVIVNPPRRGLGPGVTSNLESAPATTRTMIYVSCDPATLARDLAQLSSWRLESVQCFDMFPQTAHVETVCVLTRETT